MNEIVIIAGGKGTRSLNANTPKSMQLIGGKPLIEWQLENINSWADANIHVIGGYLGNQIQEHLSKIESKYINLNLFYHHDQKLNGTLPALLQVVDKIPSDNFAVLLGDLAINFNWKKFFEKLNDPAVDALVVTHPNGHPQDSDLVIESSRNQNLLFLPKHRTRKPTDGNLAVAGIFGLKKKIFAKINYDGNDISRDLLGVALEQWAVRNYLTVDYIKDTGTPERIEAINKDLVTGYYSNRDPKNRRVIFIDFDGTLHKNLEVKNNETVFQFHENILESIKKINRSGIPLVVISNQPGIAKGFFSFKDLDIFFRKVQSDLIDRGCYIDAWLFCPHHPESGWAEEVKELKMNCECRKPKIGLLKKFLESNDFDVKKSWMLGDSDADLNFATRATLNFHFCKVDVEELSNDINSTSEVLELIMASQELDC
jgi:mannose-1-phosphate guanylyltransferase/phosphomannomutase